MREFKYEISGTAARGQIWKVAGIVEDLHNDLLSVFDIAMRQAFLKLTQGNAVFGQPGVGCSGPYKITRVVLSTPEGDL